jgi:photosystem II stability/assembly factor-like uncharacterized protein
MIKFTRIILGVICISAVALPANSQYGRRIDLAGIVSNSADNSLILQNIIDTLNTNPKGIDTLVFPAGNYYFNNPVYVDKPNIQLRGQGKDITVLNLFLHQAPPVVFGFRQTEKNNQKVMPAHRPDCFGLLDATYAPAAGNRKGFSTQGNANVIAVGCPAQHARRLPPDNAYDYYTTDTGLTLQTAIRLQNGWEKLLWSGTIIGLGDNDNPGPWCFSSDSTTQKFSFSFRTSDQTADVGSPKRTFQFAIPAGATGPVYKIRVWLDFKTGTCGAIVNNLAATIIMSDNMTDWKGKSFVNHRGHYPFYVGPGNGPTKANLNAGDIPNIDILAFKVSAAAIKDEPATDAKRYLFDNLDIDLINFPGDDNVIARHIIFGNSENSTGWGKGFSAYIISTHGSDGAINNNSLEELTLGNGSNIGLLLGQANNFHFKNAHTYGISQGVASIPVSTHDTIIMENIWVTGGDAGMCLYGVDATFYGLDVERGGINYARFIGSNISWHNGMCSFIGNNIECVIDFIEDEYGGNYSLQNVTVDNEASFLSAAGIRIDNTRNGNPSFFARQVYFANLSPTATAFEFRGPAGNNEGGTIDIGGTRFDGLYSRSFMRFLDPKWKGNVEMINTYYKNIEGYSEKLFVTDENGERQEPNGITLNSVITTDAGTAYIAGDYGTVLKTIDSGITWAQQKSVTPGNLYSLSFSDNKNGTATGYDYNNCNGTILKTTDGGNSWAKQSMGKYMYLNSVNTLANGKKITGGMGMDYHGLFFNSSDSGASWIKKNVDTSCVIRSTFFGKNTTGYAVGFNYTAYRGLVLKTTDGGTTWKFPTIQKLPDLYAVQFPDTNTIYALGRGGHTIKTGTWEKLGLILKSIDGGKTWDTLTFLSNVFYNSIYFTDALNGYAAGDRGIIIKTTDGGKTWESLTTGTKNSLNSIYLSDANTGYAVGQSKTILKIKGKEIIQYVVDNSDTSFAIKYILNNNPNSMQVYPNPFSASAILHFNITQPGKVSLAVFNMYGERVETIINNENYEPGDYEKEFYSKNLTDGVYFGKLNIGDSAIIIKMLLIK